MKLKLFVFALFVSSLSGCGQFKESHKVSESKSLKPSITIYSRKGEVLLDSITNCSQENKNGQTDIRC